MRYKIYTRTEDAWDAMYGAIRRARRSILLEMYTFFDDTSDSHDFVEVLAQKALSGVRVKIIFDAFGSEVSSASVDKLRRSGAEVFFFRTLFRTNHRKVLIVDEEVAFIGGVNIRKFFRKWDDLMVRLEGKVVGYILRSFARMYKSRGGLDEFVLRFERKKEKTTRFRKGRVWFFEHFPPKDSFRLHRYYRDRIDGAKERILMATPYFMPNRWLVRAISQAARRGVMVEIMIPRFATNPKITNIPNYFYMHKLWKRGVKFFLMPEMNHAKAMLVDGREGILGSQNLDILSFDFDMEAGVFFSEPGLVRELENAMRAWKKGAEVYHPRMRETRHVLDYFFEFCFSTFEYAVRAWNRLTRVF